MADITLGNLYDFNKQAYANEKPLDPIAANKKYSDLQKNLVGNYKEYWMLLCRERNDYTVFKIKTIEGTVSALKECIANRGELLDIEFLEDGNYEIWLRDFATKENVVYYFFDYSDAVIEE